MRKTHFELIGGPQDGRIEFYPGPAFQFVTVNDHLGGVKHEYDWEPSSFADEYPRYRAFYRRTVERVH
jgi:hypothetical protein